MAKFGTEQKLVIFHVCVLGHFMQQKSMDIAFLVGVARYYPIIVEVVYGCSLIQLMALTGLRLIVTTNQEPTEDRNCEEHTMCHVI